MNRLILVDTHPLLYRAYYSKGTEGLKNSKGLLTGAFYGALKLIQALRTRFLDAHFIFAFDRGLSGRDKIFSGYKPNASQPDLKPNGFMRQLHHVEEFLVHMGVPVLAVDGIEADDLISVATAMWIRQAKKHFSAIIVSSDRDFLQLVTPEVLLYDDRAKKFYGPDEILRDFGVFASDFLNYKCLIGDLSDKIPSVPGFGPVRAREAVVDLSSKLNQAKKQIFKRNKQLIQLPRYVEDIRTLKLQQQEVLEYTISDIFRAFLSESYSSLVEQVHFDGAQSLLDAYECRTLKLEAFAFYSCVKLEKYRRKSLATVS